MANINGSRQRLAALVCATVLLTACGGSPAVRHYLIAPAPAAQSTATLPAGRVIGLGPVSVPDYLARPQMALRNSANRIEFREGERWAEPLPENLRRVLRENLGALLQGTLVRAYPWPRSEAVDYQVRVDVTRLDADGSGTVTLEGSWSLLDGKGGELLPVVPIAISVPGAEASPAAVAAAHGAALSKLAGSIAAELAATTK